MLLILCVLKKLVMRKYKMLSLRPSLFAVNDIVKFPGVLNSVFSIAVYSGSFVSACLNI